jgi:Sec7-like guanine-nucleotide exchange factor
MGIHGNVTRGQKQDTEAQKQFKAAGKIFNQKPQKVSFSHFFKFLIFQGIDFLVDGGVIANTPQDVAKFLHTAEGLDKNQIGSYLGEG